MGCFSFLCKKTGLPVLSNSHDSDTVHLFLLKDGKVIEHMFGKYDNYGRVFNDNKNKNPFEWNTNWDEVVNLMFDDNRANGIAAILSPLWKEGDPYPTERSDDDPTQGYVEDIYNIFTVSSEKSKSVSVPYHKIY